MFKTLEKAFTVAMLFYTTGAALPIVIARIHGYTGLGASSTELVIQTICYAVALCFIALRWRTVVREAWRVKWVLALLAVTIISAAWSQDPSLTLRRSAVLCATTAFAVYFATQFPLQKQLQLLACTFALVICASVLMVIFVPRLGVDQTFHVGDWQGAFAQKNMLARSMVLSTIVFLFSKFRSAPLLRWLGVAASLTLLALSRSVTGAIVLLVILGSLPAYRILRTKFSFALPVFLSFSALVTAIAGVAYVSLPSLLQLFHRDAGLTGRLELWAAVWTAISKSPWLGYGFSAFWRGMTGESANVWLTVKWTPGYAHNGFLDLILDMGLLGLAVFMVGYISFWRQAVSLASKRADRFSMWLCAFLTFMFFYNLTEGPALSQNNLSWVLYVAAAVNLAQLLPASAQRRAEFAPEAIREALPS